jgi:hypothetical protein
MVCSMLFSNLLSSVDVNRGESFHSQIRMGWDMGSKREEYMLSVHAHKMGWLFCGAVLSTLPLAYGGPQAIVSMNNFDANAPIWCLSISNPAPLADKIYVRLLGGPVGGTLLPVVSVTGADSISTEWLPGYGGFFDGGIGIVQEVEAWGEADFQLLAWEGLWDFEQAINWAKSERWTQNVGYNDPGLAPPAPAALAVPINIVITPHPIPMLSVARSDRAAVLVFSWTAGSQSVQLCSATNLGVLMSVVVVGSDTGRQEGQNVTITISPSKTQEFFYLRRGG